MYRISLPFPSPQKKLYCSLAFISLRIPWVLKFQELEASLGSAEFGFEYTEQVPLISAAVGAGFDPSWDYGAGSRREVLGTKWMYLLIKAPKGLTSGRALLDLEADVLVRGVRLPVVFWRQREQAAKQLTVSLWG